MTKELQGMRRFLTIKLDDSLVCADVERNILKWIFL